MNDAERMARRLETREPYKSPIQIACDEDISQADGKTVGEITVTLGQGDYPTIQQMADSLTKNGNAAAQMLRDQSAELDRLRKKADVWEDFGKGMIQQIWAGNMEVSATEIQDRAEELGLITSVPYDPERHGDGPREFDTKPGDEIFEFSAYRSDGEGE